MFNNCFVGKSVETSEAEDGVKVIVFSVPRRDIIDNTGKENGIDIVMPERTYHLIAESAEDAR